MNRRSLLLGAAVLPLTGCVTLANPKRRAVRAATFNIWHDAGNWPARLPLLVRSLRDFNAPLSGPWLAALSPPRFASALADGVTSTTLNPAKGHAARVIDHIFVERRWVSPSRAWRIGDRPEGGEYPSDHFGVAADLSFD